MLGQRFTDGLASQWRMLSVLTGRQWQEEEHMIVTVLGNHSKEFRVYCINSVKEVKVYDQGTGLLEYNALSIYKTPNYVVHSLSSEWLRDEKDLDQAIHHLTLFYCPQSTSHLIKSFVHLPIYMFTIWLPTKMSTQLSENIGTLPHSFIA